LERVVLADSLGFMVLQQELSSVGVGVCSRNFRQLHIAQLASQDQPEISILMDAAATNYADLKALVPRNDARQQLQRSVQSLKRKSLRL
jgi:hypothetical protein